MSDLESHGRFEAWLAARLRHPVAIDADGPERVMARVRGAARAARRTRRSATPATAFGFAACVVGLIAFRMVALLPSATADRLAAGDVGLRDTISAFRDSMEGTARFVGVAVIAPAAARIAIAHDFHGWDLRIAPSAEASSGQASRTIGITAGLQLSPVIQGSVQEAGDTSLSGTSSDSVPDRR